MAIGWGIIGVGNVCEVKSGPGMQQASGSALVAVMRRDATAAADFARRHGVARWYDDADRLIADPAVDIVYVATPPGTHEDYAQRACRAGKPCYVEKPMARNHAECQRLVDAFRAANLPLFVAYYRRALPRFLAVKALIDAGRLGRLTDVSLRYAEPRHRDPPALLPWRLVAEHAGGGIFLDLASHMLDLIDFLVAPITVVDGAAANCASAHDVEDVVSLRFTCANGVVGTGTWNFASHERADHTVITGSAGSIAYATFGNEPIRLCTAAGVELIEQHNPLHIQQPLVQTIVDQLAGRGQAPSTGVTGARTSWVMDAALTSYYGTRDDGFWRDPASWPGRRPR